MLKNRIRNIIYVIIIIISITFVWLKYFHITEIPYSNKHLNGSKYVDIRTNKSLNGKYRFTDNSDPNVTFETYSFGIPTGKWENYCYGDLQASGENIFDKNLHDSIRTQTNSADVFFNLWCEGGNTCSDFFTIDLVMPTNYDSTAIIKLISDHKREIQQKFHAKSIFINKISNDSIQELYKE